MKYFFYSLILLCINYSQLQSQCEFKLLASDGTEYDHFGQSVAIENDRMIVGALTAGVGGKNTGWAYVYDWNGTVWEETKLLASDGEDFDRFGKDVDVLGDRVIVGAYWDYIDDTTSSGSAYIFDLVEGAWEETKIVPSDGEDTDLFGRHVALATDRAVIGAHLDDDNGTDSGSFYIYDWNGTSWVETKITASDGATGDDFGFGLSVDEDRIVVGSIGDYYNGYKSGSVYIYDWDGSNWVESKIYPSDPQHNLAFGISTAVQGDTIVVGAYLDTVNGTNSGSVYIYIWDGSTWVETTKLTASDGGINNYYGDPVRIEDNRIIVSAVGFNTFRGKVYVYDWDGSSWQESSLLASDGSAYKRFGTGLDISGERIVSGAYNEADNGTQSGALYEYGGPSGVSINTFIGNNTDWNDPANWSLALVPTTCNHVIIPDGKKAVIMDGQSGSCYRLTGENNGTLEIKKSATLNIMTPN